jgi:hypothetical protein
MHRCFLQIERYVQGNDIDSDDHNSKYKIVRSFLNLKDDENHEEHYRQEHIDYKINPKLLEDPKMQCWLDDDFRNPRPSLLISGGPASGLILYTVST